MHNQLIGILAILLYLSSCLLLALRLVRRDLVGPLGRNGALALGFAAVLLHGVALYPMLITANGLNLGFFNAASLVGCLTAFCCWPPPFDSPSRISGSPCCPWPR
jgi:ABC-type uncharacterized transport system permease subunit